MNKGLQKPDSRRRYFNNCTAVKHVCAGLANTARNLKKLDLVIPPRYFIFRDLAALDGVYYLCPYEWEEIKSVCLSYHNFWHHLRTLSNKLPALQISIVKLYDVDSLEALGGTLTNPGNPFTASAPTCGIDDKHGQGEIIEEALYQGWALKYGIIDRKGRYDAHMGVPAGTIQPQPWAGLPLDF